MTNDEIDVARGRNRRQADAERVDSPAGAGPDDAPIGQAIQAFWDRDALSMGIPAHRGGLRVTPDAVQWTGPQAFAADLGTGKGIDDRHASWQVEPTAMKLFAEAVGADQTLFSTNGSTENVHVAMMTAVRPGETIVMARDGHRSAFAGLVLSGARPVYVDPVYDERLQVAHGVEPDELGRVLDATPQAKAVLLFTPSHYGMSSDVRSLADVAHAHGVPLMTDDAWGLGYAFCSRLPPSSMESGADLAIGSVHKTLNGLCQTSVMSIQGDRIDAERLQLVFELEQSTSASSLLLSSIDAARRQFDRDGEHLLGHAIDLALRLRTAVDELPGLDLVRHDLAGSPGIFAVDPTHVTFDVTALGVTGFAAADWLREERRVHVELSDHRRLMAIVTHSDTDETVDRFISALWALVDAHQHGETTTIPDVPHPADLRMETVMLPRDAFLGATEMVPWRQAAGRVSAEMVCPYPPGIPIVAPGERLTATVVDYLEQLAGAGVMAEGAVDPGLERLRVVR